MSPGRCPDLSTTSSLLETLASAVEVVPTERFRFGALVWCAPPLPRWRPHPLAEQGSLRASEKLSFLALVDVGERACVLLCSVAGCYLERLACRVSRISLRLRGSGQGRLGGGGGRVACDRHDQGSAHGSELQVLFRFAARPYAALSRSTGRVGFAVVIEGGGAKPWYTYACDRWQRMAASRLDTTELLRMPVRNEALELLIVGSFRPALTRATSRRPRVWGGFLSFWGGISYRIRT